MSNVSSQSLASSMFTATQQRLFGLIFGQPRRSFFMTELIELAGIGRGAVQRELARLEKGRIVVTERRGNRKHFQANPDSPVFHELCSIVNKTIGVAEQVRTTLQTIESRISLALIYGSVANQSDTASSDIDLLLVSDDLTLESLYSHLSDVERNLGRQINPTLYTQAEFQSRLGNGNAFLRRVLEQPKIMLKGDIDVERTIGKPGQDRNAESGTKQRSGDLRVDRIGSGAAE